MCFSCSNSELEPERESTVRVFRDYQGEKPIDREQTLTISLYETFGFFVKGGAVNQPEDYQVTASGTVSAENALDEFHEKNYFIARPKKTGSGMISIRGNEPWVFKFHLDILPGLYRYTVESTDISIDTEDDGLYVQIYRDISSHLLHTVSLISTELSDPKTGTAILTYRDFYQSSEQEPVRYTGTFTEVYDESGELGHLSVFRNNTSYRFGLIAHNSRSFTMLEDLTEEYRNRYPDRSLQSVVVAHHVKGAVIPSSN